MIINNFHKVIFIITVQVFHQYYYDEVTQVKCSLSRSDSDSNRFLTSWWFIPYTNLTYPLKWGIGHRVNYPGNLEFARNHMYPGANRLPFGLIIAPPCPTTPAPAQCAAGNLLGLNNLPASRSKGALFGQLNVRHAFNMTWGPTTVGP